MAESAPVDAVPVDAVPSVEPVAPVEPAAKKPVRRGRIATLVGLGLLVAAVVAGTGYTVVTVDDADRDAGAPVWNLPKETADDDKPAAATGLAGLLVPYTEDEWSRGPDLGDYGYDVQLGGAQATALRKESLRGLPRSQRRRLERQIDKQRLQGMAMRSYVSASGNFYDDSEKPFDVSVVLSRMENKAEVRDIATFQNEFLDALDVFREGPKIKGHKNAQCFLQPKITDDEIEAMVCSAYEGDVLVSATASGLKPLNTKGVELLLRTQLDRITDPGEAV
ncbi:hypothetical protein [Streptomyces aurantiacus]|uniref:hypothetical protein n=1 Tax=Streptomyces aurantiacus TaxID=47760 RepID=UPI001FDF1233|nr:hypothetical protein [Streptomyces aurantiacus]